jgi:hypothetical protein
MILQLCFFFSLPSLSSFIPFLLLLLLLFFFFLPLLFLFIFAGNGEPLKVSEHSEGIYWKLLEMCFQEMNLATTWVGRTNDDWSVKEEGSRESGLSWKRRRGFNRGGGGQQCVMLRKAGGDQKGFLETVAKTPVTFEPVMFAAGQKKSPDQRGGGANGSRDSRCPASEKFGGDRGGR